VPSWQIGLIPITIGNFFNSLLVLCPIIKFTYSAS
jgi:hypothetical protein